MGRKDISVVFLDAGTLQVELDLRRLPVSYCAYESH